MLVGIGVPFAVSLAANVTALGLYDGQIAEFFYVTGGYVTVALVSFALASIAAICAGTLFEACAFSAALLFGVTVALWGVGVLADQLLVGSAAGAALYGQSTVVQPSLLDALAYMNPVLFFAQEGAAHQFFMVLHPVYFPVLGAWPLVASWFAVFVALAGAGCALLCRRRGEQADMAGKALVLSVFSVAVFGLAAFSSAIAFLGDVDVAVALVVGAALFVLVSLVLLFGPLRGRTPRRVTLSCVGGELGAMALVVGVIAGGAFGYAGFVPQTDDVETVEVSYNGSPSLSGRRFCRLVERIVVLLHVVPYVFRPFDYRFGAFAARPGSSNLRARRVRPTMSISRIPWFPTMWCCAIA